MWFYVVGAAIGIGSKLMGYELDFKEALLIYLIFLVLGSLENRKPQS